jgi:PPOX class probable F420-dependent enzyme
LLGERIITPIDEKPKSGRRLGRLRNIASTGRAALVVDHYDEDWQRLAWVLVRGEALITPGGSAVDEVAVDALREKYPQYRTMALEQCDLIEVRIERWSWWRWS